VSRLPLQPFRVSPLFKEKVWAGRRLADLAWAEAPPAGTGEVWLVADLPGASGDVRDGPFQGRPLRDVVTERGAELLGDGAADSGFPLLVKILDVGPPLSVQVHPNGEVARELGDGERGKCEAWLILSAEDDGLMFCGLREGIGSDDVPRLSRDGTLPEALNSFRPQAGEGVEIVPGTLHTAQGLLVLEVQESCDITYRVYDYGRGRGELHLDQARRCLELTGTVGSPPRDTGWADGGSERRSVAPKSPFEFLAVQLRAGEEFDLGPEGCLRLLVVLEGQLEVPGFVAGPTEAIVLPASWSGTGRAKTPVRLGYAAARPS
jgi:mannose-6-phosphate isomerase